MIRKKINLLAMILLLGACQQSERQVENYGDVANGPGGISIIVPEEHVGGWGRRQCLLCHNAALNVHRRPESMIDADELLRLARENGEAQYCLSCHGPNGIEGNE